MRPLDAFWLGGIALLASAGLTLKLMPNQRFVVVDIPRAQEELRQVLTKGGFRVAPGRSRGDWQIRAERDGCRLVAGVTGDMGQDNFLWEGLKRRGARLHFRMGGYDRPAFPRWQAPVADQWQRQLARLGIAINRAPVIGLAEWGDCSGLPDGIGSILMHVRQTAHVY